MHPRSDRDQRERRQTPRRKVSVWQASNEVTAAMFFPKARRRGAQIAREGACTAGGPVVKSSRHVHPLPDVVQSVIFRVSHGRGGFRSLPSLLEPYWVEKTPGIVEKGLLQRVFRQE